MGDDHGPVLAEEEIVRTVEEFWSLGGRVRELADGVVVRSNAAPAHPLGNFLCRVRTTSADRLDALLSAAGTPPCPRVIVDPATPPAVEAHLIARDWVLDPMLQLVHPPTVAAPEPPSLPWRPEPATGDEHWAAIAELFRIDHVEEDRRLRRPVRSEVETDAAVRLRRSLGGSVEYTLAEEDGRTIGCIGVWVSGRGIGVIEDVFVHPEHRGRRVATGLLAHAVRRARERGGGPVVIAAEPGDTPKHLYRRFGFRPTAVLRNYAAPTVS